MTLHNWSVYPGNLSVTKWIDYVIISLEFSFILLCHIFCLDPIMIIFLSSWLLITQFKLRCYSTMSQTSWFIAIQSCTLTVFCIEKLRTQVSQGSYKMSVGYFPSWSSWRVPIFLASYFLSSYLIFKMHWMTFSPQVLHVYSIFNLWHSWEVFCF